MSPVDLHYQADSDSLSVGSSAELSWVVTVASLKGGSGKTSTAVGLYGAAVAAGLDTELLDTDSGQHSAEVWLRNDASLPVAAVDVSEAIRRLRTTRRQLTIVDTAGSDSPMHSALLERADLVLLPLSDSPLDIGPTIKLYQRLNRARMLAKLVFCNVDRLTSKSYRNARSAQIISDHCLQTVIPRREAVKQAAQSGIGIHKIRPVTVVAERFDALLAEVKDLLR